MFAGEVMTAIIFSLLPFDYTFIFNNILGSTTGNCIVCIFTLPLLYIKPITKLMNKIENSFNENAKIIVTFLLILAIGALGYKNAIGTTNIINIIMNIIILITIVIIVYLYLSETMKTQDLSKNYNELFDYLDKYEKEIVEKRKIIHDYKNQLIIINGYIGDNEKLKEYVKELIDEQKIVSDNSLINNIDKLPRGLKGLIYYKLSHIDKSVKANLSVKTSLKKFDNMTSKLSKEVLKIIGVLLDNAIEAVANEKEKFINIEFSIKKNVFIMIMENYCTEKIDIKNIMEAGYSTKGKDRGYGMALIKDILKKQKNIDLKINIKNSEFVTELEVKI
jgi:two-component system sensor histidine kinase AgrC